MSLLPCLPACLVLSADKAGGQSGLSEEELAFYDALTKPAAIRDFYTHETLIAMTKDPLFSDGVYTLEARERDVIVSTWTLGARKAVGVFSLRGNAAAVGVPLDDGTYRNILNDRAYPVDYGTVSTAGEPIVFMI